MLGWLGVTGAFAWYYFLVRTSPSMPIVSTGQIERMVEHAYVFYITSSQSLLSKILFWFGFGLTAAMYAVDFFDKRKRKRRDIGFLDLPTLNDFEQAKRDIMTAEMMVPLAVCAILCGAVIGTGGRFPFALGNVL